MRRFIVGFILIVIFGFLAHSVRSYIIDTHLLDPVKHYQLWNMDLEPEPIKGETLHHWLTRAYAKEKGQSIDWQMKKHSKIVEVWATLPKTKPDQEQTILKWTRTYGTLPMIRVANKAAEKITPEIYDPALQGPLLE